MKLKTFRIEDNLDLIFNQHCNEHNLSDGFLIRQALIEYFKAHRQDADTFPILQKEQPKSNKRRSDVGKPKTKSEVMYDRT